MASNESRIPSHTTSPLGEVLHHLRIWGTLYCSAQMTAPWSVAVPDLAPALTFAIVTSGRCTLEVSDGPPLELESGHLALLPHGTPHVFRTHRDRQPVPLFDLPVDLISDTFETLRHGGGGAATHILYGVAQADRATGERLIRHLPDVIHVTDSDATASEWLHSTARFIAREATAARPGGDVVISRLADIMVIQALRTWLEGDDAAATGMLGALRDPHLGPAIAAVHREPGYAWSVPGLAKRALLSRSVFSARFADAVGEAPMQYVTRWRMTLARQDLETRDDSVGEVAARYGYESQASFGRAFRRVHGISPGRV